MQLATRDTKTTAHSGMLDAAKAIVDDLQHTGVFESLLTGQHDGRHKARHDCKCATSFGASLWGSGSTGVQPALSRIACK